MNFHNFGTTFHKVWDTKNQSPAEHTPELAAHMCDETDPLVNNPAQPVHRRWGQVLVSPGKTAILEDCISTVASQELPDLQSFRITAFHGGKCRFRDGCC